MAEKNTPSYEIGYGKPPKHTQFKAGQSGNPHGRPKNVTTFDDDVQQELSARIVITEDGKRKKITKRRVMAKQHVNKAVGGHVGSTRIVLAAERKQKIERGDNLQALLQEFRTRNAQHLVNNDKDVSRPDKDYSEGQDD